MGCDIHAFVEFKGHDTYRSLTHGIFNIPRDYDLFTVLALGPGGMTDELPYPPRGLPADLSSDARYYFYTPAESIQKDLKEWGDEDARFDPDEYLSDYWEAARQEYKEYGLLPSLELHSHSWLNLPQLKEVLAYGKLKRENLSPEFCAIVGAMEELADRYGREKVRLVFCFDGFS